MQVRNDRRRWGSLSMALHWLVAVMVIGQWGLGLTMARFVDDLQLKYELYQLHKSLGFTVFCLVLVRLSWRVSHPHPRLPDTLKPYERALAHITHGGLYALLLLMPVTGYVTTEASAIDIPTKIFGLFTLPDPFGVNEPLHGIFDKTHMVLSWLLAAILILHIGAALKHHFVLKDDTLRRMLPVRLRKEMTI